MVRTEFDLSRHTYLIVLGDCALAMGTYVLAFLFRSWIPLPFTAELMPSERFLQVRHYWWLILLLQPALLFVLDTYHEIRFKGVREFAMAVSAASLVQVLILIAVYFFTGNLTFPRTVFPIYWMFDTAAVVLWRVLIQRTATRAKRRVLIVGGGALAEQLTSEVRRTPEIGLEVIGIISDQLPKGERFGAYEVLGGRDEIASIVLEQGIEEVILTPEASWKDRLVDSISRLREAPVRISLVPSVYEILIGRIKHFNVRDIPLIEVVGNPNDPVSAFFRRLRDLMLAVIFTLILLPLWAVIALAIRIGDGKPAVFSQDRVGQWGHLFRLYKFRTMPEGAEDETGPVLTKENDSRLTPFGRFLRRYRIDETLQLVNVIRGEMSLVGPRPERPDFVSRFVEEIHGYNERHKVKPGITGLAQIRGHYHSDPAIKLKYDLAYVYNYSFLLDLMILFETVRVVFRRQGI